MDCCFVLYNYLNSLSFTLSLQPMIIRWWHLVKMHRTQCWRKRVCLLQLINDYIHLYFHCYCFILTFFLNNFFSLFQRPNQIVAIKAITKKNLAKSQNLLGKEIKILKVTNKHILITLMIIRYFQYNESLVLYMFE